jgi:fructose-1,6-bisphosphatase/sedoheptulose 1,7-bisphosphatase-like protein
MRQLLSSVSMRGVVVIGEGEKDQAPMLFNGEEVGNGSGPDGDVAGAIAAARPESGTDILVGIGGTPEGIIAAAAMRLYGWRTAGTAGPEQRRGTSEGDHGGT